LAARDRASHCNTTVDASAKHAALLQNESCGKWRAAGTTLPGHLRCLRKRVWDLNLLGNFSNAMRGGPICAARPRRTESDRLRGEVLPAELTAPPLNHNEL